MAEREDCSVGSGKVLAGSVAAGHWSRIKGMATLYVTCDAICTATAAMAFKTGDSVADFVVGAAAAGGALISTLMLLKMGGYTADQLFVSSAAEERELRERGGQGRE